MIDFQDVLISSSQDDTMLNSASEFLEARVSMSYLLLQNLIDAAAGNTDTIAQGVADKFVAVYNETQLVYIDTLDFIRYLFYDFDTINVYVDPDFPDIVWDPSELISQVSDGIAAVVASAESVKACIDANIDKSLSVSSQLLNRLTLRFADLSDAAANYGLVFLDLIKDPKMSGKDKVLALLDFLGIGDAMGITSNIMPQSGFRDLTGANVWTAFSAEVSSTADSAWKAVKAAATKIFNGLGKIANAVAGKFINKVKDVYLTAMTYKDSFSYNSENVWGGFADYGTTTKFIPKKTGTTSDEEWWLRNQDDLHRVTSKLYTDRYTLVDLPAGRLLIWKDADDTDNFFVKVLYKPVPPSLLQNFVDNIGPIDVLENLNTFAEYFTQYQDQYPIEVDSDMDYAIYWAKVINRMFIEFWLKDISQYISGAALDELFGDQYGVLYQPYYNNLTNKQLAQRLTGHDSGNIYTAIGSVDDDEYWVTMVQLLNSLLNNNDIFIPYYHTYSCPNGQFWVTTDFELANFATTAFIGIAATIIAVTALVVIKRLKYTSYVLNNRAGAHAFNAVGSDGTANYTQMTQAYKLQKRAGLVDAIISTLSGSVKTLVSGMINVTKNFMSSAVMNVKALLSGDNKAEFADVSGNSISAIKQQNIDLSGDLTDLQSSVDDVDHLIRGY